MDLRRLDPRVKIFLMACLSAASLAAGTYTFLLALLVMAAIMLLAGGIKIGAIWSRLKPVFGLIAALFLLQCLFNRRGDALLSISGIAIVTNTGFRTAIFIALRLLIIILSALIVSAGDARDYLLALTSLKIPYEIAFMTLVALRFLPLLREEANDVLCAAQLRGLQIKKTGLKRQIGAYTSIVLPVLAGAIRRAEDISIAMESRAFRAFPRRTTMRRLSMRREDWLYMAVFCVILAASAVSARVL